MSLRLQFADKYRLWADVVRAHRDRLFVPCDPWSVRLGERALLELLVGEVPLVAHVDVVGVRHAGTRFQAGVWVHVDDDEADKLRRFLGLKPTDRPPVGRHAPRLPCQLEVTLRRPGVASRSVARNLSAKGLRLETDAELHSGQFLEFELALEVGGPLVLKAEVHREDGESGWGLQFIDVAPEAAAKLRAQLERLQQGRGPAKPRVVVADDDPSILEFLTRALERHDVEVARARSGEEALSLIRALRPALVLLDILMPGIDGADICRAVRADVELAHVPIVFLSALDPARLHEVADDAGASDYLQKPVGLHDLLNVVGTYLKDSR